MMNKKEKSKKEKEDQKNKDQKEKGKDDKKKLQVQLRVFEEDDYFEEFEEGKIKLFLNITFLLQINYSQQELKVKK